MKDTTQAPEYTAAAAHAQRHLGHAKGECRTCKGEGRVPCVFDHLTVMECSYERCPPNSRARGLLHCDVPCPNCDGGEP